MTGKDSEKTGAEPIGEVTAKTQLFILSAHKTSATRGILQAKVILQIPTRTTQEEKGKMSAPGHAGYCSPAVDCCEL